MAEEKKPVATQPMMQAVDVWGYILAAAAFVGTVIDQIAPFFPDKWKPVVLAFGGLCAALAGIKTRQAAKKAAREGPGG